MFRTYLVLVAGLFLTAVLLDMGFDYLQSSQSGEDDRWLVASFNLIEHDLLLLPEADRVSAAESFNDAIGASVQFLQQDEISAPGRSADTAVRLVDADGNAFYLRHAPALDGHLRIGPIAESQDSILLDWLPPLFYLSIFVIVGLWLWPLLNELNLITNAAQRFAADYREPLATANRTSQLKGLASNLDEMSSRLSGMIRSQKELIAALSHEMRTPLARIRFALAVMSNKDKGDIQEQLDELGQDVLEIDQLIGTMLNYARLDHPELRMNWQVVPLDEWLSQTIEKCRQPGRTISVVNRDNIDTAEMDPRLMSLALGNLLTNASRYATEKVVCTFRHADGKYSFSVEDDGKGIPESDRESIFKAFSRIDNSRNRETGGYGLGLAIVSRIAVLHGGSTTVDSSAAMGGALFTISWRKLEP